MRASVFLFLVPASLASYSGFLYYRIAWLHYQGRKALRHVDEQLGTHHELLPHLLLALASYAHHEGEVLNRVIKARKLTMAAISMEEKALASLHLSHALHHLFRASETCHRLHADDQVALIHMKVVLAEQKIAIARDYYNTVISHYNGHIDKFPSSLVARVAGFKPMKRYEFQDAFSPQYSAAY